MFKVGEYIVHGRNGVCKIEDITPVEMSGADKDKLYYVLLPMKSEGSKIFFPVDSDKIVMRSVVTKDEAENILKNIKDIEPIWIDNEKQRELKYREAISSCDCTQLIGIIKTLCERSKERMEQGKRVTYVDDRYFKEAKETLHDEFSIALGMEKDEVEKYIAKHIE